jgi:hypothetical protein
MDGRGRPLLAWLLDAVHVIIVVVVAAVAALVITSSWAPRVVIFGVLVALLAVPVKWLLGPAYRWVSEQGV